MRKLFYLSAFALMPLFFYAQQNWSINGNAGTKAGTNYLGTKDAQDLVFKTNSIEYARMLVNGSWRFGIIGPDYAAFDNKGNLSFSGIATYKVGDNIYAFQDLHKPGVGLFRNTNMDDWEFRDETATPFFTLNSKTRQVISRGGFQVGIIGPDHALFDDKGNLSFSGIATYNVGDNIYAFQDLHKPGSGLYLNTNPRQWEFRDEQGTPYASFNGDGRTVSFQGGCQFGDGSVHSTFDTKGNLRFFGSSGLRVSLDQYGLQCDAEPLEGLYMNGNPHQWEFRDEAGVPYISFNVSNYDFSVKGGVKVGYSNTEEKGNIRFNGDGFQGFDGTSWKTFVTTETLNKTSAKIDASENTDLQEQINSLQKQIAELKSVIELLQKTTVTKTTTIELTDKQSLQQNSPNPFSSNTVINYALPSAYRSAQIMITNKFGNALKQIELSGTGKGTISIKADQLPAGAYQYSLIIDGKTIESKQMILVR